MFYQSDIQIDELGGTLSAQTVVNVQVDCVDGHTLSCVDVQNLVVEAKHSSDGAYTDIEHSVYDLSPYAGDRETFNVRLTPSTAGTYSFKFRKGPAATSIAEWATFGSVGVTFGGHRVTFESTYPQFLGETLTLLSETVTFGD